MPFGFIARNSGVSLPPYLWPTSCRRYGKPSSPTHHIRACTLEEVARPQISSIGGYTCAGASRPETSR